MRNQRHIQRVANPEANSVSAFVWLAGFAVAIGAHLWFHPQRSVFIEALQFMRRHPLILLGITLCHIAALHDSEIAKLPEAMTLVWPDFLLICVENGVMQFGWLMLDVARWHEFPRGTWGSPWLHDLWQGCAAAVTQTALCLFCLNQSPKLLASRWRSLIPLALILTLFNACTHLMRGELQWWIILEALLVAAPLPFCIAFTHGNFIATGKVLLRLWRKLWTSWIGFAITAVLLLALLNHTTRMLALHPGVTSWIISAVFSALIHLWLFTAGVLLMRNAGYLMRPTNQQ